MPVSLSLEELGWNADWEKKRSTATEGEVGRVIAARDGFYTVATGAELVQAQPAGVLFHKCTELELPAVGDWVILNPKADAFILEEVLERRSTFVRRSAGKRAEAQVIAANIDTVFVVMGVDGDYNLRRLERYLVTVFEGNAEPVVLLSKADLSQQMDELVERVRGVAPGVAVLPVAALHGRGLEGLRPYLGTGKTVALVGSSGAGKSTLLNALYGDQVQRTQEVRENDSRGRHTTTHRELFPLSDGTLVIDTPGLRELGLWTADKGLELAFRDIFGLAQECRFGDCAHEREPQCAVRDAIDTGDLCARRFESYKSLAAEADEVEERSKLLAERRERQRYIKKQRKR